MKIGKVERYINEGIAKKGGLLFIVVDPCDHKSPESAAKAAKLSSDAGADMILVGGSIGAQGELLDVTTKLVKESVDVPVNLFPGNTSTVTRYADAIYFMTMLNSRNPYWLTTAQATAAPVIKRMGIEAIPTGYIVVAPGGTVGWVGEANLVPRDKPSIAAALALGGEYSGNRVIITDVGSASKEGPVPIDMVRAVAKELSVPYVVAGGIRTPKQAKDIISAGAGAIQVGTAMEKTKDVKKTVGAFVKAVREGGRKRK